MARTRRLRLPAGAFIPAAVLAFTVLGLSSARAAEPSRIALLVGNDAYEEKPLRNAANDARDLGESLKALGFDVAVVCNATRESTERAVVQFAARIERDSIALFHYSGHGFQIDGENYLVPVGFRAKDEIGAKYAAFPVGQVLSRMERSDARLNVVVLDACRDNPYRTYRGGSRGLALTQAGKSTLIAYATSPGSTASDNSRGRNGLFTHHLLRALEVPGLGIESLFRRVRAEVYKDSRGEQHPWTTSSVLEDFVLRPLVKKVEAPAPQREAPRTRAGESLLGGAAAVVSVDPPDGQGDELRFEIANLSPVDLSDHRATIVLFFPSESDLVLYESAAQEMELVLRPGGTALLGVPTPEDRILLGWELHLGLTPTIEGTTFLDGSVRCTAVRDELLAESGRLQFEVENVSSETITVEYRAVFRWEPDSQWSTDWAASPGKLAPGERVILEPSTAGLPHRPCTSHLFLRRVYDLQEIQREMQFREERAKKDRRAWSMLSDWQSSLLEQHDLAREIVEGLRGHHRFSQSVLRGLDDTLGHRERLDAFAFADVLAARLPAQREARKTRLGRWMTDLLAQWFEDLSERSSRVDPRVAMPEWQELLGRLDALSEQNPANARLAEMLRRATVRTARVFRSAGHLDLALLTIERVLVGEPSSAFDWDAIRLSAEIHESMADAAANEGAKLEHLRIAAQLYESCDQHRASAYLRDKALDLRVRRALSAIADGPPEQAEALLDQLRAEFPDALENSRILANLIRLRTETGILELRTVQMPVSGTPISELPLRLRPISGGKPWEGRGFQRLRWPVGEYELTISDRDGKTPLLTLPVHLTPAGTTVVVPLSFPSSMVFVPVQDERRPFFIDRTEVTVGQFREVFPERSFLFEGTDLPAHGISYREAEAFARARGLRLPTREQWLLAAFHGGGDRFPWGDAADLAQRCHLSSTAPVPVGSLPAGASRLGVQDLAGNVWEWLRDGTALGAGFLSQSLSVEVPGWDRRLDALRDPRPGPAAFQALDAELRERYSHYRLSPLRLHDVGLRCVMEF